MMTQIIASSTAPITVFFGSDRTKRPFNIQPMAKPFGHETDTTSSEPVRVLLVDDNEALLVRAKAVLTPGCAIIGWATDGPTALKAAMALQPQVIVLDISMKGMNGLEVAMELREAHSTAAVVFLTVHEEKALVQAARDAGAIGYVVKPRLASDLMHAVREARAGRSFVSPMR